MGLLIGLLFSFFKICFWVGNRATELGASENYGWISNLAWAMSSSIFCSSLCFQSDRIHRILSGQKTCTTTSSSSSELVMREGLACISNSLVYNTNTLLSASFLFRPDDDAINAWMRRPSYFAGAWSLAFASRKLHQIMDLCPLHVSLYLSQISGRMPPAERSALYTRTIGTHPHHWHLPYTHDGKPSRHSFNAMIDTGVCVV